jgi:hypothetical protein
MKTSKLLLTLNLLLFIPKAWAFDKALESALDNYYNVVELYKKSYHEHPKNIEGILAHRFINTNDWVKSEFAGQCVESTYGKNVWVNWYQAALKVSESISSGEPLSMEVLNRWRGVAMNVDASKINNQIKTSDNFGSNVNKSSSLTLKEIKNLTSLVITNMSNPLLKWTSLVCKDDLNMSNINLLKQTSCLDILADAKKYLKINNKDVFWLKTERDLEANKLIGTWYWYACWPRIQETMANKNAKYCGMVHYLPSSTQVIKLLKELIVRINAFISQKDFNSTESIIKFAITSQREFVAIHPYPKGNGRMSRFVMDYILANHNIPSVWIEDMDKDLAITEEDYFKMVINSINETTDKIYNCYLYPKQLKCKIYK